MKVAINTLSSMAYGAVSYLNNFLPALAKIDKTNDYFILVSKQKYNEYYFEQKNFHFLVCDFASKSLIKRFFWEQFILPFRLNSLKIDAIYTTNNLGIFLTRKKVIIALRNMDPLCYRNYQHPLKYRLRYWILNKLTKLSIKKASKIIAVSNYVKQHLINNENCSSEKVKLIYHGNNIKKENKVTVSSLNDKYNFNFNEPFILSALKFIPYANVENLIDSYWICKNKMKIDLPLVIAGGVWDKTYYEKVMKQIQDKGLETKVNLLGYISSEELQMLYKKSKLFVFPSTLEACPNTLIEAMASGAVIASSTAGPMTEIGSDGVLYFDPDKPDDIAEKMTTAIKNKELRTQLTNNSKEISDKFSWEKCASATLKLFNGVYSQ